MTVIPEEVSRTNEVETKIRPNHAHSWDEKEHVKLACGCIMPVLAGAHTDGNNVQSGHGSNLSWQNQRRRRRRNEGYRFNIVCGPYGFGS